MNLPATYTARVDVNFPATASIDVNLPTLLGLM